MGWVFGHAWVVMLEYLVILVGTFSEDMITTGIPFSLDDPCMHAPHLHHRLKQKEITILGTVMKILICMYDLLWILTRRKVACCRVALP
jgi:hypothetical protein